MTTAAQYAEYVEAFTASCPDLVPMSFEDWQAAEQQQAAMDRANRTR